MGGSILGPRRVNAEHLAETPEARLLCDSCQPGKSVGSRDDGTNIANKLGIHGTP